MRIVLVAVLATLICTTSQPTRAQSIAVQSGEHKDFSRLVVSVDDNNWSIARNGRTVILTYQDFYEGFDTSRVFEFIPRTRVKSVVPSPGSLTIDLECDCAVAAFLEQNAYVVIDIATSPEALEAHAVPVIDSARDARVPGPPEAISINANPIIAAASEAPRILQPSSPNFANREMLSPEDQQVLTDVQDRLVAELSTATHRGMLAAVPDPTKTKPQRPQIDTRVFIDTPKTLPLVAELAEPHTAQGPQSNLRIHTSRDLPETFRHLSDNVGSHGLVCPTDENLNISAWGNTETFGAQIAKARQGLYGEFDRIDPQVAVRLARTYLYFGFGAEAQNILSLDPYLAKNSALLLDMAIILDGGHPDADSAMARLGGCNGTVAIWAMLALPDPPRGAMPNSESSLRSLNALPAHLRTILAPMLSRVLLEYGDPDGAAKALHSLDRLPAPLPAEATMALATMDLRDGKTLRGTQRLSAVVEDNAAQSPEALIALIDAKIEAGRPIGAETAGLVAAYAQEYKNSELGPKLRRAYALALTDSSQFDAAFEMITLAPRASATADHLALSHHMIGKLTEAADDITFLEQAFALSNSTLSSLPAADLIALANRLLELGFAGPAEQSLALLPNRPLNQSRQLLSASVALAMGKPFKSIADLVGIEGYDADLLRADAKRLAGIHEEAHQLYAAAGQAKKAAETAWLSDNWRSLTPADAMTFNPTARLEANAAANEKPDDGMLGRAASLLEESAHARDTLQSLLQAQELQLTRSTE